MSSQGLTGIVQSTPVFPTGAVKEIEQLHEFRKAKICQNNVTYSMRNRWIKWEAKLIEFLTRALAINEVTLTEEGDRAQENLKEQKSSAVLKSCLLDETPKLPPGRAQPKTLSLCRSVKRNYDDDDFGYEDDEDGENVSKKMKIKGNHINGTLSSDSGRESLAEDEWEISSSTVEKVLSALRH